MARRKPARPPARPADPGVSDYRHPEKRKNIPPAGLAAQGRVREASRVKFAYNPHLPPVLRFDPSGGPDRLPALLEAARRRALTDEEAGALAEALRNQEPWLEWAGKRERQAFEVEPVALHIHERVSTQAILRVAARQDVQRDLFADPQLAYREAVQFYQHDVDWANRMILGDSLEVMASLARREELAGKVQMIYMDPPYGIRFASNFQPEIGRRDVKDKETDLTREPEMIKAYRDTWTLGVHSYLSYLRDRLILCRELLADSGSLFVQIGDENLHRVRSVLDEVFGSSNLCTVIVVRKTAAVSSPLARTNTLPPTCDYLLWYARDLTRLKYRQLYLHKGAGSQGSGVYSLVEERTGARRRMTSDEMEHPSLVGEDEHVFRSDNLTATGWSEGLSAPVMFEDQEFPLPGNLHWKTTTAGLRRLMDAGRVMKSGTTLQYVRYYSDFPVSPLTDIWLDTGSGSFTEPKIYVVQTNTKVVERCMLMTTDPGDLVLDPTCGSGTTAYVAEQWGRRWVTIDTSRVALALARQRLLTARFDYYDLRDPDKGPAGGLRYKTVPHITLRSIAQNTALDAIFARHQPVLEAALAALNAALRKVPKDLRGRLRAKLLDKEKREGKRAVTDADRRRWLLSDGAWREWEVPFDADDEWPAALRSALEACRAAWRAKRDEVDACIAASAEPEELVDRPEIARGVVRVSGPFTVEAVIPSEQSLDEPSPIGGAPDALDAFPLDDVAREPANAEAHLDRMLRLLRTDGVRFPENKVLRFTRLDPTPGDYLQAEGEWDAGNGQSRRVAVSFGPQHGPVTAYQVENALAQASRRGMDDLVFAGFSFDAMAQGAIQDDPNPRVRCHLAHVSPDVAMGDLLKETAQSQLFTVFGSPRTELRKAEDGQFVVEMLGVDVYDPVQNTILPTGAAKVAAWFLDTDYDGRTFCITQAFFPDRSAWDRLARALRGVIDEERFAALGGTVSLPFPAGDHRRVAVKVVDPRGNEVMRVHRLDHAGAPLSYAPR